MYHIFPLETLLNPKAPSVLIGFIRHSEASRSCGQRVGVLSSTPPDYSKCTAVILCWMAECAAAAPSSWMGPLWMCRSKLKLGPSTCRGRNGSCRRQRTWGVRASIQGAPRKCGSPDQRGRASRSESASDDEQQDLVHRQRHHGSPDTPQGHCGPR